MLFPIPMLDNPALSALNAQLVAFGLSLSSAQCTALQKRECEALARTGRICFGESILPRLILTFADSPHIQTPDWPDTLGELTQLFYVLKNETQDRFSDDELLARMARIFNGPAQGSLTLTADFFSMDDTEESRDDA